MNNDNFSASKKKITPCFLLSQIFFLSGCFFTKPPSPPTPSLPLAQCGRIIAHEFGATEKSQVAGKEINFRSFEVCAPTNNPFNTCPKQLSAISAYNTLVKEAPEKTIRFVKFSLRTLADGHWVVAHNDAQLLNGGQFLLSQITSQQLEQYKKLDPYLKVFNIKDYVNEDKNKEFCYMLNTKTSPNQRLLDEINDLNIIQRTLIETTSQQQANWLNDNHSPAYFTTRANSMDSLHSALEDIKKKGYEKLFSIEVDPNPSNLDETKSIVEVIHDHGFISEVDSMPYDILHEAIVSACDIPLEKIGTHITMTNRPVKCIQQFPNIRN